VKGKGWILEPDGSWEGVMTDGGWDEKEVSIGGKESEKCGSVHAEGSLWGVDYVTESGKHWEPKTRRAICRISGHEQRERTANC